MSDKHLSTVYKAKIKLPYHVNLGFSARKPIVPFAEIRDLVDSTNYTDARTQGMTKKQLL